MRVPFPLQVSRSYLLHPLVVAEVEVDEEVAEVLLPTTVQMETSQGTSTTTNVVLPLQGQEPPRVQEVLPPEPPLHLLL